MPANIGSPFYPNLTVVNRTGVIQIYIAFKLGRRRLMNGAVALFGLSDFGPSVWKQSRGRRT